MKVHLANSNAWSDGNEYIMGTASEVHTNVLFDIYPNDTTITAEFKGNTQQNGTPSPSEPVPVVGVGYLDGTAYKIPVEIGLSTQSIDLSSVQSVRNVKKYEFTGEENLTLYTGSVSNIGFSLRFLDMLPNSRINGFSTHFRPQTSPSLSNYDGITFGADNNLVFITFSTRTVAALNLTDLTDITNWLRAQYNANTPVTIYYILAAPETTTLNEPIYKIGNYTDSISNISLTTTAGATSLGVDTAVKPSEITLNFRGWHPKDPKESTDGEWS